MDKFLETGPTKMDSLKIETHRETGQRIRSTTARAPKGQRKHPVRRGQPCNHTDVCRLNTHILPFREEKSYA